MTLMQDFQVCVLIVIVQEVTKQTTEITPRKRYVKPLANNNWWCKEASWVLNPTLEMSEKAIIRFDNSPP